MAYMIGAFAAGLAVTLVLAAFLTPAQWWRRPNVRALAVLVAGTWGVGSVLLSLMPNSALATTPPIEGVAAIRPVLPTAGRSYHVFDDLNLRAASGVGAPRIAVVRAGAVVTTTGARDGDWWEVSAGSRAHRMTGWVSSLWLRRADEQRAGQPGR